MGVSKYISLGEAQDCLNTNEHLASLLAGGLETEVLQDDETEEGNKVPLRPAAPVTGRRLLGEQLGSPAFGCDARPLGCNRVGYFTGEVPHDLPPLTTTSLLAQSPSADLLLLHGHILTVDGKDSAAQALAIRHGIIVKVGTDAEVLELAGNAPGTRVIDLNGHTATPGLIDTHAHIAKAAVEELFGVRLTHPRS